MIHRLIITSEATSELESLEQVDIEVAAAAHLLLESLEDDHDLLEYLCQPKNYYMHEPSFEVKKFVEAHDRGYNIFILKFLDCYGSLANHRIFLGFHAQKGTYYALAITNRDISYRTDHAQFSELLNRYGECGIPKY